MEPGLRMRRPAGAARAGWGRADPEVGRAGKAPVVHCGVQGARSSPRPTACIRPGEVGELLRREGLHTSHLTYWRKQRKDGALKELGRPRGRKPVDRRDQEIAALKGKLERSEAELAKMKRVVVIQGNVSALLEEMLGSESAPRSTER